MLRAIEDIALRENFLTKEILDDIQSQTFKSVEKAVAASS